MYAFLLENLKSIDQLNDDILNLVIKYYENTPETNQKRFVAISAIIFKIKTLGSQINIYNKTFESEKHLSLNFTSELIAYRRSATIDIHNSTDVSFDLIKKIEELHRDSAKLQQLVFLLKQQLALYTFKHNLHAHARDNFIFKKIIHLKGKFTPPTPPTTNQ